MKSIKFNQYQEVVNDVLNYTISQLQNKYSHEIKFLYSVLNDLSLGSVSPNYKIINKIANQQHIPFDFIVNTANKLILDIDQNNTFNYYKVLEVESNASSDKIRESWLNLVKKSHPDLIGEDGVEKTKELNEAYDILKDSDKRAEYDKNYFDHYPLCVEYDGSTRFLNRKYLMIYSFILLATFSFLLKGYFENFIDDNTGVSLSTRQLEYFEEVNKEESELKYKREVEELYSDFDNTDNNKSISSPETDSQKKKLSENKNQTETAALEEPGSTSEEINKEDFSFNEKKVVNTKDVQIDQAESDTDSVKQRVDDYDPLLNSLIKKYGSKNLKNRNKEKSPALVKDKTEKTIIVSSDIKKKKIKKEPLTVEKISAPQSPKIVSDTVDKKETTETTSNSDVSLENNPTSSSLLLFVSDYVSAYKNRDYAKMKNLFMPGASENDMDLDQALSMYHSNFKENQIIRYDIQIKNKTLKGNNAFVAGQFVVIYKSNDKEEINTRKGDINWKLKWIEEEWKINSLNYNFDKKDNYL